jgi:dihydrofolate synthase/folylpolyglutamate synthase
MKLEKYLNSKPLYYDDIDFNIVNSAWKKLKKNIKLPYVIHIVGTNGKGSTGRYLASFLEQSKFNVLHYSSPHILKFNERIWINGSNSSDDVLDIAHDKLQKLLPNELLLKLTYFEYTTLIALILSDGIDYLVLEAGLGGEFDATNIVDNDLSLITTIGLDHIEFLGDTIEKIASTKMRACNNRYILGYQEYTNEVLNAKNNVLMEKLEIKYNQDINTILLDNLPIYLQNNLKLALSTLEYLNINYSNLVLPELFGRCQKISTNITIDVGHNTLAAFVLLKEFNNKKIDLIYNSYEDKDYQGVLETLKPIINKVLIIEIKNDNRIAKYEQIANICKSLSIPYDKFNECRDNTNYLVFGSFKVVEEFLLRANI